MTLIRMRATEPADSPVRALREALATVPGQISRSKCGCVWKRVVNYRHRGGVVVNGDLIVRRCGWHEWYAALPADQKARFSARQHQVRREGRPAC